MGSLNGVEHRVVAKALNLLTEEKWCVKALARKKDGSVCKVTEAWTHVDAIGALAVSYLPHVDHDHDSAVTKAARLARKLVPGEKLWQINDEKGLDAVRNILVHAMR